MKVKLINFKDFILCMLIIGTVIGPAFYIGISQLQIFRMVIIFILLYTFYIFSKRKVKFINELKLIIIWFSVYYIWTVLITIFNVDSNIYDLKLNSYINFTMIFILVLLLAFWASFDYKSFVNILVKAIKVSILFMFIVALWEILTHNHLKVATFFNNVPDYIQFMPATFYTNPNDFMAMLTLMNIFLIGYYFYNKKLSFFIYLILFISLFFSFVTSARLAMLVLLFSFLLLVIIDKKIKYLFIIGVIFSILLFKFILNSNSSDIEYLLDGLSFGGESTDVRGYLYKDAVFSIENNYGLGFGIDNSASYYKTINDFDLNGIINPHNYFLEILLNSGIYVLALYILLKFYFTYLFFKRGYLFLIYMLWIYDIILISSSSSLYLWFHYVYFIGIISLYKTINSNKGYLAYEKNS